MTDDAEQIHAKLVAYLEGQLSGLEKDEIEQHLQANPSHLALMQDLSRQRDMLRALPRESAPADLMENLQSQLEREALLNEPIAPPVTLRIGPWRGLLAAAAIGFLAVGLGVVVYSVLPAKHPAFSIAPTILPPTEQPMPTQPPAGGDLSKDAPSLRDHALAVTPPDVARRVASKAEVADGVRLKGQGESEDMARVAGFNPARAAMPAITVAKPKGRVENEQPIAIDLDRASSVITVTTDNLAVANTAVNKYLATRNISFTEEPQSNVQLNVLGDKQQVAQLARARQSGAGARGFGGGYGGFGGGGIAGGSYGAPRGGESTMAAKSTVADRSDKNATVREQIAEVAKASDPMRERLVERNLRGTDVAQKQLESEAPTTRPGDGAAYAARGPAPVDRVDAYNMQHPAGVEMQKTTSQKEIASGRVILARMNARQATELADALAQAEPVEHSEQQRQELAPAGALNQAAENKADDAGKLQSNRDVARAPRAVDEELRNSAALDQKKSEDDADQKRLRLEYRRAALGSFAAATTQPAVALAPSTRPATQPVRIQSKMGVEPPMQVQAAAAAADLPASRPSTLDLRSDGENGWVIIVQGRQADASSVAAPNTSGVAEASQAQPVARPSPTTQPAAEVPRAK